MRIIITCIMAVLCLASGPIMAMDFLIGAKAGYFVWEPFFKDLEGGGMADVDSGEGVLYGPVMSLIFTPSLSFSVSGFFGQQNTHWYSANHDQTWEGSSSVVEMSGTYYAEMFRIDIDSALSYRISDLFKVFLGYKFQRVETEFRYTERRYGIINSSEHAVLDGINECTFPSHGPAIGIGISKPLTSSFFFAANFSFLYLWSEMEINTNEHRTFPAGNLSFAASGLSSNTTDTFSLYQIGVNFEPTIGAQVGDTGVVVTLSARIQYMNYKFTEDTEIDDGSWHTDILYGLFASVMYTL